MTQQPQPRTPQQTATHTHTLTVRCQKQGAPHNCMLLHATECGPTSSSDPCSMPLCSAGQCSSPTTAAVGDSTNWLGRQLMPSAQMLHGSCLVTKDGDALEKRTMAEPVRQEGANNSQQGAGPAEADVSYAHTYVTCVSRLLSSRPQAAATCIAAIGEHNCKPCVLSAGCSLSRCSSSMVYQCCCSGQPASGTHNSTVRHTHCVWECVTVTVDSTAPTR
jgi:hypothetical protein